jgi:hypothetical protein
LLQRLWPKSLLVLFAHLTKYSLWGRD